MKKEPIYYIDLISRYLDGEANAMEVQELFQWINADPANQEIYQNYYQTWILLKKDQVDHLNIEENWEILKLKAQINPSTKNAWWYSWKMAAMIVVLLGIASIFLVNRLSNSRFEKIQSSTRQNIQLPDGTKVLLNPGAVLEYDKNMEGRTRNVRLAGEAYFNVFHDSLHPFILEMGNTKLEVLGTAFYVNTQSDKGTMSVILTSGKVKLGFLGSASETCILQPGEKAIILKDQQKIEKNKNTDVNYMAWVDHKLEFTNARLDEVIDYLCDVYQTKINIKKESIKNLRITATFENQPLESVLKVLTSTLDLQISQSNQTIELSNARE